MKEKLNNLKEDIKKNKKKITNEEITKNSCIMPFFKILGYNIFNVNEFHPEYTSDVGNKNGEKVDYAILKDGNPLILIEAKKLGVNLDDNYNQLYRYFTTQLSAKVGILTNGVEYRFYSDTINSNVLDDKPFFVFNILDFNDQDINTLKLFTKNNFNVNTIKEQANKLYYTNEVNKCINNLLSNPDEDFLLYITKRIVPANTRITDKVKQFFNPLIKEAISSYCNQQDDIDQVGVIEPITPTSSRTKSISLKNDELSSNELMYIEPISITINDQVISFENKKIVDVYKYIFKYLINKDKQECINICDQIYNRRAVKKKYLSDNKNDLRRPFMISDGLYIDLNLSAYQKLNILSQILTSDKFEDIIFTYYKKK